MNKQYNVGLYARLSVVDSANSQKRGTPFRNESASIENQKAILREYSLLRGWNIMHEYVDDGFSGGSYNRPAFHRMLDDAKAGLINLILVKDLSRLGRDYIETGRYTDEVFPALGVRFIALMDNLDSAGDIDLLPFRSLLNDYHLKDLSRKIKSATHMNAKNGNYIGSCPYGFIKNPENPARLAIDEYAAGVVRKIFTMRSKGISCNKIAATLNGEGVLAPRAYYYDRKGTQNPCGGNNAWQFPTILTFLKNEAYLGHSVKLKSGTMSYKNKQRINKSKENWVRCENTHPAIVSQELWDAAQSKRKGSSFAPVTPANKKPLFYGVLRCEGCGGVFTYATKRKTLATGQIANYVAYTCCLYSHSGRSICSPHSISELTLLEILRQDIRRRLEQSHYDESRVINVIHACIESGDDANRKLDKLSKQLAELESKCAKLYEKRLNGTIALGTFKTISASYEEERVKKLDERDKLAKKIAEADRQAVNTEKWRADVRSFLALENPSREIINVLIERIEVGENEGKRKHKRQSIKIFFRDVGQVS
ncbi:MAG: recombinase family protein [Defluviitaleaceae bacterium]|nr:recombinase family protein [Defluviitaleaceae bacterium]